MSAPLEGCVLCEMAADDRGPGGGWTLAEDHWFAGVLPGYDVPGWLVCGMRRHGEGPDSMDAEEAASIGGTVQRLSAALREVTGAERIYLLAFGEEYPHLHFMLVPRPPGPGAPTGMAYLAQRDQLRDAGAASSVAADVRAILERTQTEAQR